MEEVERRSKHFNVSGVTDKVEIRYRFVAPRS